MFLPKNHILVLFRPFFLKYINNNIKQKKLKNQTWTTVLRRFPPNTSISIKKKQNNFERATESF